MAQQSRLAGVLNTPIALSADSNRSGGFNSKEARSRHSRNVQDAKKFVLGPMPVQDFFDAFFKDSAPEKRKEHMLASANAFNRVPACADEASGITEPLAAALNSSTKYKSRCPGFIFENTSVRQGPKGSGSMKPDICCFASPYVATLNSSSTRSRIDMGNIAFFIDVKPDPTQDFFCDPPSDAGIEARSSHQFILNIDDEDTQEYARRALGQHISYATEMCARQHRTFCFSICMAGSRARLVRWDRAGAIVTESFDIREKPELLCEFLWRFSHASDIGQGYDTTVGLASDAEETLFRDAITAHVKLQLGVDGHELEQAVGQHYKPGVVSIIPVQVKDDNGCHTRRFIVSRPLVSPLWPTGRGTRGYWAVDPEDDQVVFLKDTWRYDGEEGDQEGNILHGLNDLGICCVPTLECHGDVHNQHDGGEDGVTEIQRTMTDQYTNRAWVCGKKKVSVWRHIHYRLVERTVGYSLKLFRGTEELLFATYDVFQAMKDVLNKDDRIHRDISLDNIILVREAGSHLRRGCLIDWEVSCKVNADGRACDLGRAGTWRYMSYNVLDNEDVVHSLSDDMESLLYVVLYCSLRWLPHDEDEKFLAPILHSLFDYSEFLVGRLLGGNGKYHFLSTRRYVGHVTFTHSPIQEWLNAVADYRCVRDHFNVSAIPETWSDPKHLDAFWTQFLASHTLEANDRIERVLVAPSSFARSQSSSMASSVVSSDEQDVQGAPPRRDGPVTRSKSGRVQQKQKDSRKPMPSEDESLPPRMKRRRTPTAFSGVKATPAVNKRGAANSRKKQKH